MNKMLLLGLGVGLVVGIVGAILIMSHIGGGAGFATLPSSTASAFQEPIQGNAVCASTYGDGWYYANGYCRNAAGAERLYPGGR